ncbi:hypothetical protein GGTG_13149 [Gaeumannomyces tritici R3-111a-1]|uniref:Uncharacterized protein n=1 Tax=Gaeumannomyces tritici (strain R3-111a-1) TaxID=644352 RepID=J3PI18_GAET3|nr:hypothetical protein GGTG_13149 [Gaeumannomyces tritici R3-111a-1]EJT69530.1 hypothetical protein GGTG_13149 [Gaeumannomyces tritici R3-111a-1]
MSSSQDAEMSDQDEPENDDSLYDDDDDIYDADAAQTGQQAPVVSGYQSTAMTAYGNPRTTTWQAPAVASYRQPATTGMANVSWDTYRAPATGGYLHNAAGAAQQATTGNQGGNVATAAYQTPVTGRYSSTATGTYQPPVTGYVGNIATSTYRNSATSSYQNPVTASYQGSGTAAYDNTAMSGTEYVEAASAGQMPVKTQQNAGTMTRRSSSTNTVLYAPDRALSPAESEHTVVYAPSGSQQTPEASSQDVSEAAGGKRRPEPPGQETTRTAQRRPPPDHIPIPESSSNLVQIPSLPAAHYAPVRMQQAVSRALLLLPPGRRDSQGLTAAAAAAYPDRLPAERYLRTHTRFGSCVRLLSPGTTRTVELLDYEVQAGGGLIVNLVWGDRTAPLPPACLLRHEYEYASQLGVDTLAHVTFLDVVYVPVKAMVLAAVLAAGKAPEGRHVFRPGEEGWDELRRGNSLMALAEQAVGRPARCVEVEGMYLNTPRMKLDDLTVWF